MERRERKRKRRMTKGETERGVGDPSSPLDMPGIAGK